MRTARALLVAIAGLLVSAAAQAHPHIWIQEVVRVVAKDGKYTHGDSIRFRARSRFP